MQARVSALLALSACFLVAGDDLRYGLVFDAGSSGTRIHVYTWKTSSGSFDLVEDDILKLKPGLSAYAKEPGTAGSSLDGLLEHAKKKIPQDKWASTPAFLMATAGLRMVGEEVSRKILDAVCKKLGQSSFMFQCDWAYIMPGQDEGLYGWVTVNYLLDTLYPGKSKTGGIIDLGGGSVQIVYQPTDPSSIPADYKPPSDLNFSGRKHSVYLKSHLGFGLDAARNQAAIKLGKKGSKEHPCLPKGVTQAWPKEAGKGEFTGTGDYEGCTNLFTSLFDKTTCQHTSCSFGGAYQPALTGTFYGFSYMYDRTAAIGLLDKQMKQYGTAHMTINNIVEAAKELCATEASDVTARFSQHQDASKSNNFCGDVVFIAVLLEHGLGFSPTQDLVMTNKIKDVELVWTLGAMLAKSAALDSGEIGPGKPTSSQEVGGGSLSWGGVSGFVFLIAICLMAARVGGIGGPGGSKVSRDRLAAN